MSEPIELRLPWPPSVNTLHRRVVIHGRPRTLLSERGRAFLAEASAVVRMGRAGRTIAGRAWLTVTLHAPDRRRWDIDNRVKAVLDAMTHGGLWADDDQVDVLTVMRGERLAGGAAVCEVREIE